MAAEAISKKLDKKILRATYADIESKFHGEGPKMVKAITFPETAPDVYTIDHTFVDDSLRGQGVAGKLVAAAVKQIKANGGQVAATCSYAQHWLAKHPE